MMDTPIIRSAPLAGGKRVLERRRPTHATPLALHPEPIAAPAPSAEALAAEAAAREREIDARVAAARAQLAAAMQSELETRLEAEREAAREQGLEDGRAAGREEVLALDRDSRTRLAAAIAAIGQAHDEVRERASEDAVVIGFAAACRILGEKMVTGEGVRARVEQVIARARHAEGAIVRLNPRDAALVSPLMECEPLAGCAAVTGDGSIEPGGCRVDTSAGSLEARLDDCIVALRDALVAVHAAEGSR